MWSSCAGYCMTGDTFYNPFFLDSDVTCMLFLPAPCLPRRATLTIWTLRVPIQGPEAKQRKQKVDDACGFNCPDTKSPSTRLAHSLCIAREPTWMEDHNTLLTTRHQRCGRCFAKRWQHRPCTAQQSSKIVKHVIFCQFVKFVNLSKM